MKRILAVPAAAVAAAALAVAAAGVGTAAAAPRKPHHARPAAKVAKAARVPKAAKVIQTAKTAKTAKTVRAAKTVKARPADPPVTFDSEFNGGQFVTIVSCSGNVTPPPVHLAAPGAPLTLSGTGPSAGAAKLLKKPGGYKTVYTCTIVVKKRVPAKKKVHLKKVVISTGFGGEAGSVAHHHPAG